MSETAFKMVNADYRDAILNPANAVTFEIGETYDRDDHPFYARWGFRCYPSMLSYWLTGRGSPGHPPSDRRWYGSLYERRMLELSIDVDDVIVVGKGYPGSEWSELLDQFPNARLLDILPGKLIVTRVEVVAEVDDWLDAIDWTQPVPAHQGLPL